MGEVASPIGSSNVQACAAQLRVSPRAQGDTAILEQRLNTFLGEMKRGVPLSQTTPLVPNDVADRANASGQLAGEVKNMIGCVGNKAGLNGGVVQELKSTYDDAASSAGARSGLRSIFPWIK